MWERCSATGILGAIMCFPVASMLMGKEVAVFFYVIPFLSSTLCGTVIAALLIGALCKSGAFQHLGRILEHDGAVAGRSARETAVIKRNSTIISGFPQSNHLSRGSAANPAYRKSSEYNQTETGNPQPPCHDPGQPRIYP